MTRSGKVLGAVLAVVLALTACAGQTGPSNAPDAAKKPGASAEGGLDFTVATLDGSTFDGKSLAGRPALLWFWAPWCPTCVIEAPTVKAVAEQYAGKVAVVGVAGLDKADEMRHFVELTKVEGIEHLADEEGVVWKRFGVTTQSSYVLLDASGAITHRGRLSPSELEQLLVQLVG